MLRLRLGPEAALEIPDEGPQLGSRSDADRALPLRSRDELALAVFTSEGCHVCRALEPAIASLAHEPVVALETFEEAAEPSSGRSSRSPAAPSRSPSTSTGTVLAKGTFNNLAQLESVLAAAERRRAERDLAGTSVSEPGAARDRARRASRSSRSPGDTSRRGFLARVGAAMTAVTAGGVGREGGEAGRGRRLPLLRSHLHDRLVPAPDRACRGSTGAATRCAPPTDSRSTTSGGAVNGRGSRSTTTATRFATPTAARCRPRRGPGSARRPRASTASRPRSTAAGIAAAAARSASSSTAAPTHDKRINGDAALEGYCYRGRKVFCVMYFQTKVPC